MKWLTDDRRLLSLPPNRMGQRMADTVGQIVDRSRIPEAALSQASWNVAITEYRYRIVPQQLISVRKFWLLEEFVIRPWGPAGAPTREEVQSALVAHPIYADPEVLTALAAFRPRLLPDCERGPA